MYTLKIVINDNKTPPKIIKSVAHCCGELGPKKMRKMSLGQ